MSSPTQWRAANAADAFWTLDPLAPVSPGDPWYAELESHFPDGSYDFVTPLVRRLTPPPQSASFQHVGVVGHRGVGKSTLVRKAMGLLEQRHGFCALSIDVEATLDQGDFTFPDVLISVVQAVAAALRAAEVPLPAAELELFRRHFAEELLTDEHVRTISGPIAAQGKAADSVPFFAELMTKVTALLRSDNLYRQHLRSQVERDPRAMLERVNVFLDAAAQALGKRLVLVFDNLEKVSHRKLVEEAVLQRSYELRALHLSTVLFLHPADEFAPQHVRASEAFPIVHLPMLPVRTQRQRYSEVSAGVLAAMRDLLARRLELEAIFEDVEACLYQIVRHSGGRLRDVLELARGACELVDHGKVTVAVIDRVAHKLAGYRAASLGPEDRKRLVAVMRSKQVPNDREHGYLLLHSMVLQYNGVPWWDLHPLLLLLPDIGSSEWAS